MVQVQIWLLYLMACIFVSVVCASTYVAARRGKRIRDTSFAAGSMTGAWHAAREVIEKFKASIDSGCDVHEIRDCLERGEIPQRVFVKCDRINLH
jgi:hypothetical protein